MSLVISHGFSDTKGLLFDNATISANLSTHAIVTLRGLSHSLESGGKTL